MTNTLATVPAAPLAALGDAAEAARAFAVNAHAANTQRAYRSAWAAFVTWCEGHGLAPLPATAGTVALYLSDRARHEGEGAKVATLSQGLIAIAEAHRLKGFPVPSPKNSAELRKVWQGIRRARRVAPRRKDAAVPDVLRAMLATMPGGLIGQRDRALLLLGFAGAFRRSELVALEVSDLTFDAEGLTVRVRASKTDQEGAGAVVGIRRSANPAMCPVAAVRAWLDVAGITDGAVLRSVSQRGQVGGRLPDRDVARRVQLAAKRAGLDASRFGAHSLRAGLATAAAKRGASTGDIMRQGRWKSAQMVEATYVRPATVYDNDAAGVL
jgi:integrase